MTVKTRLAPSPTGYMHIGTARAALFNWLYAKHTGGKFALRIEDTDRSEGRFFEDAAQIIYNELGWLGLGWDELVPSQLANTPRHTEVALQLLERGAAYYCYMTPEEISVAREESRKNGKPIVSPWRNGDTPARPDVKPVIRLRIPGGKTVLHDQIQGDIEFDNGQIEDLIILRSDGTPTYNLSVAVDDHDMAITNVIRGADHISNTPKQMLVYTAMGWEMPKFAHAPLILAMDGSKMSKRHGATTVGEYREAGFLPSAIINYLLRLGWSHGNDEIISRESAIEWFEVADVGSSPAKFDAKKLLELNAIYMRATSDEELAKYLRPFMACGESEWALVAKGIPYMKERSKTLIEMAEMARIYIKGAQPKPSSEKELRALGALDAGFVSELSALSDWSAGAMNELAKAYAAAHDLKLGDLVASVRVAISGALISPPLFESMEIIGKGESMERLSRDRG